MVEAPTTGPAPAKATVANGRSTGGIHGSGHYPLPGERFRELLREHLEARHLRVYRNRLERDEAAYRWCLRKAFAEGATFRTSYAQAAVGMGLVDDSLDITRESHWRRIWLRHHDTVKRSLDSLADAGLISWGGFKKPNGQWGGLEVQLLPNGDQCLIVSVT
jgi:hypothetical protein